MFTSAKPTREDRLRAGLIRRDGTVVRLGPEPTPIWKTRPCDHAMAFKPEGFCPLARPRRLARELKLRLNATLVGCYGRIARKRALDAFCRGHAAHPRDHPDVVALVMGRANEKYEAFEKGLKTAPVPRLSEPDALSARGARRRYGDFYRVLDLLCRAATWEGFDDPIEAMGLRCCQSSLPVWARLKSLCARQNPACWGTQTISRA